MSTLTIHVCTGCGATAFDPGVDLAKIQKQGHVSCCPERRMVATAQLPYKLGNQIEFAKIPQDPLVPESLRIDHPYCWQWTGRQNRNGYGRTRWEGREPVTHRLVWFILREPIPSYILLDHRCRNRLCCNPNHLDPVTNRTNTLRGEAVLFKRKEDYV